MEPRKRTHPDEEARELDERADDLIPEDDEDFDPDGDDLGRPVQLPR